jgi:uncharacterized protein YbjQ (UPF0145 family)
MMRGVLRAALAGTTLLVACADAFDILLAHAQKVGANAVVGIRYDATEIKSGGTEVLCYGTAVVDEPV